ncbi:MAG: pyruvate ferredoxin oxidoreductase [Rhodobacteraceae bacterium]|nr:pyruvate ferredoxin oxidoreductase [Paracoccaceae bacterium]
MDNFEVRFSGSGGQGLILSAKFLSAALMAEGYNVAQSQSYEPVSRGGLSRSDLVVSKGQAAFPLSRGLDYLLILHGAAAHASDGLLSKNSLVLVDSELVPEPPKGDFTLISLPFTDTARKLGNKRVANIVALSALVARAGLCPMAVLENVVRTKTPPKFANLNMEAFEAGQALALQDA